MTPTYDTQLLAVFSATLGIYACAWVVNVGWDHWLWLPVALALYAPSLDPPLTPAGGDASAGGLGQREAILEVGTAR
jgi:hypothetical protein